MSDLEDLDRNIIRGIICHMAANDEVLLSNLAAVNLGTDSGLSSAKDIIYGIYDTRGRRSNLRSYLDHGTLPGEYLIAMSALGQKIEDTVDKEGFFDWNRFLFSAHHMVWGSDVENERHDGEVYMTDDIC